MIVTVFFLVPTTAAVYGPFAMFYNSNFLLHLLNPLFSIMTFVCFEKTNQIDFIYSFAGIIPMLIYAVYYLASALSHTQNGMVAKGYDWYGFFFAGTRSVVIVIPIIVLENEDIPCVTAWCAAENIGSRRALEKAGMRFVCSEKDGLVVGDKSYEKLYYEYK